MIKATIILTGEMVRKVCIANKYFVNGDNAAYSNVLKYADKYSEIGCINETYIYDIAKSIVEHTHWLTENHTEKEAIKSVMFMLSKESYTIYEIEE